MKKKSEWEYYYNYNNHAFRDEKFRAKSGIDSKDFYLKFYQISIFNEFN